MHVHRTLAAPALALAMWSAAAAEAGAAGPATPVFEAPRAARTVAPAGPHADPAVREIVASEHRFTGTRGQAAHRATPQPPPLHLPEPPLGALVFAAIGALVLLRGRRIERP